MADIILPSDPNERNAVKAQAWADKLAELGFPISFNQNRYRITVHNAGVETRQPIRSQPSFTLVWVIVSTPDGTGLDHEHIEVVNPPIGVRDVNGVVSQNINQAAQEALASIVARLVGPP
jgi:hypothetical protein